MPRISAILLILLVSCATREVGPAFTPGVTSDGGDAGRTGDGGSSDGGEEGDGGDQDGGHSDGGRTDGGRTDGGSGDGGFVVDGGPSCEAPRTRCSSGCVDTDTDARNCGTCSHVCPGSGTAEAMCSSGNCALHCVLDPPGQACPAWGVCSNGHCCASGQTWCSDRCVDVTSDPDNCGSCGQPCHSPTNGTAACQNRSCQISCSGETTLCDAQCVDIRTDANNCGVCGNSCLGGACMSGLCVAASATCTISANSTWQTCGGLSVSVGDVLILRGVGRWVWSPSWDPSGCDAPGEASNPVPVFDYRYVGDPYNYGALLWGIENGNIGGSFGDASWDRDFNMWIVSGSASSTGRILFRINDEDASVSNNTGSMSVRVDVLQ